MFNMDVLRIIWSQSYVELLRFLHSTQLYQESLRTDRL